MDSRDRLIDAFAVRLAYSEAFLSPEEVDELTASAMRWHLALNPLRAPYSRPDRRSLDVLEPGLWRPVFDRVRDKAQDLFVVRVGELVGRESVIWPGTHLPTHVEGSDLSAVMWLRFPQRHDLAAGNHEGVYTINSPSGPPGFEQRLHWERRTYKFKPVPGAIAFHPSYLHHYAFPLAGDEPGVEIHFEIGVA